MLFKQIIESIEDISNRLPSLKTDFVSILMNAIQIKAYN